MDMSHWLCGLVAFLLLGARVLGRRSEILH